MATDPNDAAFLQKYGNYKPAPANVPVTTIKPIIGGESPEEAAARRAREAREARGGEIAESAEERAARKEKFDVDERTFQRGTKLYDQFVGRSAVKNYEAAWPAFTSALSQPPTTSGDRVLIYNAIKILDPEGAVPTGDIEGIQSQSPIIQRIVREFGRVLDQGGTLPDQQRIELRQALDARVKTLKGPYDLIRTDFERRSQKLNLDPLDTIGSRIDDADKEIYQNWLKQQEIERTREGGGPVDARIPVNVVPEQTGKPTQTEFDLAAQNALQSAWNRGASADEIAQIAAQYNQSITPEDLQWFRDNPGKPRSFYVTPTVKAISEPAPSFYESLVGAVTGEDRATPTTEALPDWTQLPELTQLSNLVDPGAWQTAFATALGGSPTEIAQIVQDNFPGTRVRQDEKGNLIFRSSIDNRDYAIKPGFQLSDIPRAGAQVVAGLIGGGGRTLLGTAGREAAVQTGIETFQAGAGGTFNPADIAAAGALGAAGQKIADVAPAALQRLRNMRGGDGGGMPPAGPAGGMPSGGPAAPSQTVRRYEGVDYPVDVIEQNVVDGSGNTWAKVRDSETGQVGFVPQNELITKQAPSGGPVAPAMAFEGAPAAPMAPSGGMAPEAPAMAPTVAPPATAMPTGEGGLSAAPSAGARPLRFNVAPTDILERATTRAKPSASVLDDASIADREVVLDALGIPPENRRLGALTGNKTQIEDEVMVSKLGEGSERMQEQFELESRNLGEYALDLVDQTGGTLNLPPLQRGIAIVKPLEDYQAWYNQRIKDLYRQADTAAAESGVPITLQGLDDALKVNSTFGSKSSLMSLRRGVRQYLREQGIIDAQGKVLPVDTQTAERVRQYLNNQWSPETSGVIGMLKGKIDDDVISKLPIDVYAGAREMRRNYANIFEEPKSIAQLLDISGPEGVNRRIALDVVGDKLTNLAQKDSAQFNFIINTLQNLPTPTLQQAGTQAAAEIRANILESILKKNVDFEDISQGGDAMWRGTDLSTSNELDKYKGKLENIFGPDVAQRLETLRVGARILRPVDPNPSGTATTSQRLLSKKKEAAIRAGSALVGGGIGGLGGPTGSMVGAAAGERIGARLADTAENRARQAAIARSLDAKEKAKHLAKMRSRSR